MTLFFALLSFLWFMPSPQGMPFPGPGMAHATSTFQGVLDVVSANANWCWSLRACSAALRGTKAVNLCDTGDAHCADASTDATTGDLVVPSSNPNCSASGCTVKTIYDQIGSVLCSGSVHCDMVQATEANRPVLTVNCLGGKVCMTFSASAANSFGTPSISANVNQPSTVSAVAERSGRTSSVNIIFGPSGAVPLLGYHNAINLGRMSAGSTITTTVSDSSPHAIQALFNNTSSNLNVDGTDHTGTAGTTIWSGGQAISPSSFPLGGFITEIALWSADKSASFSALNSNQHTYWGF